MSAITSGRWEVSGQYVRTERDADGGGWLIADCRDSSLPWEECCANARLIAAAPDLHEANVAFVDAINDFYGFTDEPDEWIYDDLLSSALAGAYFKARAAIAKARGEA